MARRGDGPPKAAPVKAREAHPGKLVAFHLGISAESSAAAFDRQRFPHPGATLEVAAR